MNYFKDGWYTQEEANGSGIAMSLKCVNVLHQEKSDLHNISVFQNDFFGRCLVTDNGIQRMEDADFAYQESIAFIPLNSHASPKKVLVISVGDIGVPTEVLKHPMVDEITMCIMDKALSRVSQEYFQSIKDHVKEGRLKIVFDDGMAHLENHSNYYDVIIVDRPARHQSVEEKQQFHLWEALKSGGIICSKAEPYWTNLESIKAQYWGAKNRYKSVKYASICVPMNATGQCGILIACKDELLEFSIPVHQLSQSQDTRTLKYYSAEIHKTSFILPSFVQKALESVPKNH